MIISLNVKKIVAATRNVGKISEIRAILQEFSCNILPVTDIVPDFFVEEDGKTYRDNAIKKARAAAELTGSLALADDSGLEVDALNGAPGVYSARFGGESLSQAEKNRLLLRQLDGIHTRSARFRCVIAVAIPNSVTHTTAGICEGIICDSPQGTHGFGYDPLFFLPEHGKTMAELSPAVKNSVSHRARALSGLPEILMRMQNEGLFEAF